MAQRTAQTLAHSQKAEIEAEMFFFIVSHSQYTLNAHPKQQMSRVQAPGSICGLDASGLMCCHFGLGCFHAKLP